MPQSILYRQTDDLHSLPRSKEPDQQKLRPKCEFFDNGAIWSGCSVYARRLAPFRPLHGGVSPQGEPALAGRLHLSREMVMIENHVGAN
jgi:hypothetical protein